MVIRDGAREWERGAGTKEGWVIPSLQDGGGVEGSVSPGLTRGYFHSLPPGAVYRLIEGCAFLPLTMRLPRMGTWPWRWVRKTWPSSAGCAEQENEAGGEAEVVFAVGGVVGELGLKIIGLDGANGEATGDGDVDAAAGGPDEGVGDLR